LAQARLLLVYLKQRMRQLLALKRLPPDFFRVKPLADLEASSISALAHSSVMFNPRWFETK
jgi:hypothetical protein